MMPLQLLWLPSLIVVAVVAVYTVLFRRLFARRVHGGLAAATFCVSLVIVGIGIAVFFLARLQGVLVTGLLGGLQQAADLVGMLRLALIYAALPEEAVKIGAVAVVLLAFRRHIRRPNDAAQLLLFSALGFALPESLLYVYGFAAVPDFRAGLPVFALMRGALGGLLHLQLALIAGLCLLRVYQPTEDGGRWRWIWFLPSYLLAVLAHTAFDGSLLHLIFQGLAQEQAQHTSDIDPSVLIPAILAVVVISLLLIGGGLFCLGRILRAEAAPTAASISWRIAGGCVLLLALALIIAPASLPGIGLFDLASFGEATPRAFGLILLVLGMVILMKRRPLPADNRLDAVSAPQSASD